MGAFDIDTDPRRLDVELIHAWLAEESYWARDRSRATVERSLRHSLCFGAYAGERQIGFARVVTDRATYAWLCDVFVLAAHRRKGVAVALMEAVIAHPELQGLRRFQLVTRDAHGLYERFGFHALAQPERHMERDPAP